MTTWASARFQLDWLPGEAFAGYTDGSDWNGFERPYFDRQTAVTLLRSCESCGFAWEFNEASDEFVIQEADSEDGYEEVYAGETIEVGGSQLHLYPIGAGSWIWGQTD